MKISRQQFVVGYLQKRLAGHRDLHIQVSNLFLLFQNFLYQNFFLRIKIRESMCIYTQIESEIIEIGSKMIHHNLERQRKQNS